MNIKLFDEKKSIHNIPRPKDPNHRYSQWSKHLARKFGSSRGYYQRTSSKKHTDTAETLSIKSYASILKYVKRINYFTRDKIKVGVRLTQGNESENVVKSEDAKSQLPVFRFVLGLCYAEFGARTPRAGSAYIYSYVCVGQFIAFIIGWNLILEYIIGSASVARGISLYIDSLLNDTLKIAFTEVAPINISFLSKYFDFMAFGIALTLSIALAFGIKESSMVNNVVTILNLCVMLFIVIAGSIEADTKNWHIPKNQTIMEGDGDVGEGGFFPFGVSGMIKGAATCFYGFVGFDCIATTGEEVKNPQKAIPIAIITSLFIVFLSYFGTSTVVTLMIPYYEQDVNSPIAHAFEEFGWEAAKWIVTIGGIFALFASLFGAMFPLPRIIYAMASDGLVFKFLGIVSARFSTPVIGTLLAGLLTGIMGGIFEQGQLVDMMSIGTLLAYTIVAACVLLLRYSVDTDEYILLRTDSDTSLNSYSDNVDIGPGEEDDAFIQKEKQKDFKLSKQFFNLNRIKNPTNASEKLVVIEVCIYCVLCIILGSIIKLTMDDIKTGETYAIVLPSVVGFLLIVVLMSIGSQPTSKKELAFKVPLVPIIPALSILVNIYLMLSLDVSTWIRFGIWMAIGLPIYFYSALLFNKDTIIEPISKENTYHNYGYVDDEKKSNNSDSAYFEDVESGDSKECKDSKYDDSIIEVMSDKSSPNNLEVKHGETDDMGKDDIYKDKVIGVIHKEDGKLAEIIEYNGIENNPNVLEKYNVKILDDDNIFMDYNVIADFEKIVNDEQEKLNQLEAVKDLEEVIENVEKEINFGENENIESSDFEIPKPPPFPLEDVPPLQHLEDIPQPPPLPEPSAPPLILITEGAPPPPPPPPDSPQSENYKKIKLPRVTSKTKYLKPSKKNIIEPPVDYSRQNSSVSDEVPIDNVKFGGTVHRNIVQKLEDLFKQRISTSIIKPNPTPKFNNLPPKIEQKIDVPQKRDDQELNQDDKPEDIKEKLSKLLVEKVQFISLDKASQSKK